MNSHLRRNRIRIIHPRNSSCRMVWNSSFLMWCLNAIKYRFYSRTAQRSSCRLETLWALLFLCSLKKPLESGHLQRHLLKSRGLKRHKRPRETLTAQEEGYLKIHYFIERARWGGSATTLSLCSIRRSWIPSHSLSMVKFLKILNKRSEIRWTIIQQMILTTQPSLKI